MFIEHILQYQSIFQKTRESSSSTWCCSLCIVFSYFQVTIYLIEMPFNTSADTDQAALVRATWLGSTLFAYGNVIRHDPTPVDL